MPTPGVTASFVDFPAEAFEFYESLAADPTKNFWNGHKAQYGTRRAAT